MQVLRNLLAQWRNRLRMPATWRRRTQAAGSFTCELFWAVTLYEKMLREAQETLEEGNK